MAYHHREPVSEFGTRRADEQDQSRFEWIGLAGFRTIVTWRIVRVKIM